MVSELFCVFLERDIDDSRSSTGLKKGDETIQLLIEVASNFDFEGKTVQIVAY
jgi:hypothetical protein